LRAHRHITVQPGWLLHVVIESWAHGVTVPTQLDAVVLDQ